MPAHSPEEVDTLFEKAINAGDAAAVVALYEPNATLVPQPGQIATGTVAIHEAIAGLLVLKPKIKQKVTAALSGGDVAALYNDWTGSFTGPDGAETHVTAKAIEVVRRQGDGTWLFVVDDPFARGGPNLTS